MEHTQEKKKKQAKPRRKPVTGFIGPYRYSGPPAPKGFKLPEGLSYQEVERTKCVFLMLFDRVILCFGERKVLDSFIHKYRTKHEEQLDELRQLRYKVILDYSAWKRIPEIPDCKEVIRDLCRWGMFEFLVPPSLLCDLEESNFGGVPDWFPTTLVTAEGVVIESSQSGKTGGRRGTSSQCHRRKAKKDPIIKEAVHADIFVSEDNHIQQRYSSATEKYCYSVISFLRIIPIIYKIYRVPGFYEKFMKVEEYNDLTCLLQGSSAS